MRIINGVQTLNLFFEIMKKKLRVNKFYIVLNDDYIGILMMLVEVIEVIHIPLNFFVVKMV